MTMNKDGKGDWKYVPEDEYPPLSAPEENVLPSFGSTYTSDKPVAEVLKELGYESPEQLKKLREEETPAVDFELMDLGMQKGPEKSRRVLVDPVVKGVVRYRNQDVDVENLKGLIRRLEKSNEELGLALHKCMNPEVKGWD